MDLQLPDREEIRQMNKLELEAFARQIRSFLVDKVSKKGGHLASNLGMVELTLALWRVFDFPKDKVIFDVGHQSYTYKLLSGRKAGFDSLREFGGMSGFPKCNESPYDSFDTGHSATSISAGLGLVHARDLLHENYQVISVIGDGAMTGGEAFEALDNVAALRSGYIIVLNDNEMSISKNVGGLSRHLTGLRSSERYNRMKESVKRALSNSACGEGLIRRIGNTKDSLKEIVMPSGMIFENLGIKYLGPVDGHDVLEMEKVLRRARDMKRPVLIHVLTKKGKGYGFAEKNPALYHGVGPFDPSVGVKAPEKKGNTYADAVSEFLMENGETHPELCTITAAMGESLGFGEFKKHYPKRYFDVGIAEQHAVTFSAGLAKGGLHPILGLYSSFAERGYDQLLHDVCMQNLPVTILLDRAGLVGKDGETHQGAFDLAFMGSIPNLTVLAPADLSEFREMLRFSLDFQGPLAIRYPRGSAPERLIVSEAPEDTVKNPEEPEEKSGNTEIEASASPFVPGKGVRIYESGKTEKGFFAAFRKKPTVSLITVGKMTETGILVARALEKDGISAEVLNMRSVKPFDGELVREAIRRSELLVTLEDGVVSGGFGEKIAGFFGAYTGEKTAKTLWNLGLPDQFIPQGNTDELMKTLSLDPESVTDRIRKYFS